MINKKELANGVRIVTEHIPFVRSITIGIWVGTGSRYEKAEENGISHFLEHMFFKGTNTRTPADIAENFDRIGGQVNAFTAKEYTCFYAKVLDEHAGQALDILSDMFFHSTFDEEELEKERSVIFEEIKMVDDTPDDIVHDYLDSVSYGSHSLGRPILGTTGTVGSFTAASLKAYLEKYYTGSNVVISVAGNTNEAFLDKVEETFSVLGRKGEENKSESPVFLPGESAHAKQAEQAHLCLGFPGLEAGHADSFALVLLNNVLGGSMSSRLFQDIRETRGLAYSVYSYQSAYRDSGMLTIYGGTGAEHLDEMFDSMQGIIKELSQNGIHRKEWENGKEQLKGSVMLGLESTSSRMNRNGRNELLLGYHQSLDDIVEKIEAVTLEDTARVAHALLGQDYSISLISPEGRLPENHTKKTEISRR